MRSNTKMTVIFTIIVAAVLIGEVYVYTFDTGGYSSEVSLSGDTVSYSMSANISTTYSLVISDNGSFTPNQSYYIYYDAGHGSEIDSVTVPVGARAFTQDYYISQLISMLEYRGIVDIEVLNAKELKEAMADDVSNGTTAKGLIVLNGALPDTIYTGNTGVADDPVFDWLAAGGRLYWAGNFLGRYVATEGGVTDLDDEGVDYQMLFFGTDCLNTGVSQTAYSDVTENDYRYALSLMNNSVKYGIDASAFDDGDVLQMGYTDGTYSSAVMVRYRGGDGMICVLGGDYSNNQRHDLAQMISSGLCYSSHIIGHKTGDIRKTTVQGTIEIDEDMTGHHIAAYVYYGGYFPMYGRLTELTP